ncbi:unnamed protein product [Malus baccata var. baccata]
MASSADNIPHELLANIGNRLNTTRFRAVCKSWRSSIPPFKNLLQLPLELSSAVYHLAPPTDDDPQKRGWLINVKEVGPDRQRGEQQTHRAPHPLSCLFEGQPKSMPRVFNLLEFRVVEVAKMYFLVDDPYTPDDHFMVAASLILDLTFEILKLEAHKKQWVKLEAQALDDQILVLGDDGWYSLSARDFPGCNELKNMFREVAVYNLGSGPVLQLTDIPSSNNIFCPRPTWRWRDTPELSCRHDERG